MNKVILVLALLLAGCVSVPAAPSDERARCERYGGFYSGGICQTLGGGM